MQNDKLRSMNWDELTTPGLYVGNETGVGYLFPDQASVQHRTPTILHRSDEKLVQLSQDPGVDITQARRVAIQGGLEHVLF